MAPFTVLGMLELEVERILRDESLVPISHFNSLVAHELADQPTPYIYERLGEKYRHYFIDEFQDTSLLQWQNLIPLIGNALEGEDADGVVEHVSSTHIKIKFNDSAKFGGQKIYELIKYVECTQ